MPTRNAPFLLRYGSFEIGGSSAANLLVGRYSIQRAYRAVSVRAEVVVVASSEALFISRCQAIEAAFRTPRQRVTVEVNGTTLADFDPTVGASGNTGFNAEPSIEKSGSDVDSARSRLYVVSVTAELPADLAGQAGRDLDATVNITATPAGVLTVTFRGRYTALTDRNATEVYDDEAEDYAEAYLTANLSGITFELISPRNTTRDDTDKTITFELVYQELIEGQGQNALDDPDIIAHSLVVVRRTQVGQHARLRSGAIGRPLQEYAAQWSCFVAKAEVANLATQWDNDLRPWVLQEIRRLTGATGLYVISDEPSYDPTTSRIIATINVRANVYGGLFASVYRVQQRETAGIRVLPVADGDPDTAYVFRGKRLIVRTVTISRVVDGLAPRIVGISEATIPESAFSTPSSGQFIEIERDVSMTPAEDGVDALGDQVTQTQIEETYTLRWVKPVEGAAAGADRIETIPDTPTGDVNEFGESGDVSELPPIVQTPAERAEAVANLRGFVERERAQALESLRAAARRPEI